MSDGELRQRVEDLRENVEAIQDAVNELRASGLTLKTVVVLLSRSSGVKQRDIHAVLDGIDSFVDDHFADPDDTETRK